MMHRFGIAIAKDRFKFSASHMTIFPDGTAERLHGHNYRVRVTLSGPEAPGGMLFNPVPLKRALGDVCGELDEMCLMPGESPHLKLTGEAEGWRIELFGKTYVLPREDVVVLPMVNITMEALARYIAGRVIADLKLKEAEPAITQVNVEVEESQGQGVWFEQGL